MAYPSPWRKGLGRGGERGLLSLLLGLVLDLAKVDGLVTIGSGTKDSGLVVPADVYGDVLGEFVGVKKLYYLMVEEMLGSCIAQEGG